MTGCPHAGTLEGAQQNSEGQPRTDLAIGHRIAVRDIDGELVVRLPDQSDQSRYRLFHTEFPFVKDFRHRPHLPFRSTFDDLTNEEMLTSPSESVAFVI